MPDTRLAGRALVKVDGGQVSDAVADALLTVRVEVSSGVADWCEIVLDAHELELSNTSAMTTFAVARQIEVSFVNDTDVSEVVFVGDVTGIAFEANERGSVHVVTAYDRRHTLGSEVKVRTFVNVSYKDVLTTIAGEAGLGADIDASLANPKFPHLIQSETNHDFVDAICRRTGCEWSLVNRKLRVKPKDDTNAVTLKLGYDLRSFSARYTSTEHASEVQVRGWDPQAKRAIRGSDKRAQATPRSTPAAESTSRGRVSGKRVRRSWGRPVGSVDEANQVATSIARRMGGATITARGEALGNPSLTVGSPCTIEGVGDDWSGVYYVTSAEHVFGAGQPYITRFQAGTLERSSLVDLFGPERSGGGPGSGVTIGIVTNNNDQDKHQCRVKVKFPYLGDDIESDWVRLATIGGGPQRGVQFLPEVDDEVLVAFEHGDLQRPYVIGTVWNGVDKPPLTTSVENGKVLERLIVSRLGHRIRLRDGDGADDQFVSIELADGKTKAHIGASKIEVIANNKPIELKTASASVLLTDQGDIKVKGAKVTIEATGDLELKGTNVTIKANAAAKISGNGASELKSTGPLTVQSSANLALKGTIVQVN